MQSSLTGGIAALKSRSGEWVRGATDKANLLATTFSEKFNIPAATVNEFTPLEVVQSRKQMPRRSIDLVENVLSKLKADSATGPDLLPVRILKEFIEYLCISVLFLAESIVEAGRWPAWRDH